MPADEKPREVPRLIEDHELRSLKTTTFNQLRAVGGADAFAPSTRVLQPALSNYGNKALPDKVIPLDVAIELDRAAASPLLIGAAARMLDCELVPRGREAVAALGMADAREVAKETSDVVNVLLDFLSSGAPLDEALRRELLREIGEAKAKLYQLALKIVAGTRAG